MSMDSKQPSEKDRKLFALIAHDIRIHRDDYRAAGKWLDEYCGEQAYWERRQAELEEMKEDLRGMPAMSDRVKALEEEIRERRTPGLLVRFQETRADLLNESKSEVLLSIEDAKRVLVVSWLLTDPDAENADSEITELQRWRWEPVDDLTTMSRGVAHALWVASGGYDEAWVGLVQAAWDRVKLDREASIVHQPSSQEQSTPLDAPFAEGYEEKTSGSILGDTLNFGVITIYWRRVIERVHSLRGYRKLIAIIAVGVIAVAIMAWFTRPIWGPLVAHPHSAAEKSEQEGEVPDRSLTTD